MEQIKLKTKQNTQGVEPTGAWLTVNRACNLRCSWCYAKGTEYNNDTDMSLSLATKLIDVIKPLGIRNITIIGGEPTLWSHLLEFNSLLKREGIESTLVTNGTRFGNDNYWDEYCRAPNTRIGLSIKAYDGNSFYALTQRKAFDLTKAGIKRALCISRGGAGIVYSGSSADEIAKLARFAVKNGAKSLGISPSTPAFINSEADPSGATVPSEFIKGIVAHYPLLDELFNGRINIAVKLPLCIWPREFMMMLIEKQQISTTCQLHHRSGLIFDTDGTLLSCNSLSDFPIGKFNSDYHDTESLKKHLKSQSVISFYNSVMSYPSHKCAECEIYKYCAGGCPLFYGVYDAEELIPGWDVQPVN